MENYNSPTCRQSSAGFTLPAVLVVTGALLILAIGALMVVGIERSTARSFVDRNRADLAVQAGLEDIRALFDAETSNDDYMVIESPHKDPMVRSGKTATPAPYLFIARGKLSGGSLEYRQVPLFSNVVKPNEPLKSDTFVEQLVDDKIIGPKDKTASFETLPYLGDAQVSWLPVLDSKGKMISRYAYWVEDLQGKLEAKSAGNLAGADGLTHKRFGWTAGDTSKNARFPAPGINPEPSIIGPDGRDTNPPLSPIASYLLTPDVTALDDPALTEAFNKDLIQGRNALISPNSILAAAKVAPPLSRDPAGFLTSKKARVLEENFVSSVMPYEEQPLVPFSPSIATAAVGKPKLNLNALLAKDKPEAVDEMAAFIDTALPKFKERKGSFPDDYLKTLAAGALDYADIDSDSTVSRSLMGEGSYRGLDGFPLMSEIILHVNYKGIKKEGDRVYLEWDFTVFVELWNHTNSAMSGNVAFSYENKGRISPLGTGVEIQFDDPDLLADPLQIALEDPLQPLPKPFLISGGSPENYWFQSQPITLAPNQYQFVKTAILKYKINVELKSAAKNIKFSVNEALGISGMSLKWNNKVVDRVDSLVRQGTSPTEYRTGTAKESGKANIVGHSYGPFGKFKNNMGDSRQALYFRSKDFPASDNAYPANVSINRRNIRNQSVYKNGGGQNLVYGRVLPSEWPDGGHNVSVFGLPPPQMSAAGYDPTNAGDPVTNSREGQAPTFLSNQGRFYSATELGRTFDPIMFQPKYDNVAATNRILNGMMPDGKSSWPSVELGSLPDKFYGGGNTLRIGRPEHPLFSQPKAHLPNVMPQDHAARLLDLFHTGKSRSSDAEERGGRTVRIEGNVNINTASVDSLRALAGGLLQMDPEISERTSEQHSTRTFAPPTKAAKISAPTRIKAKEQKEADIVAEGIIRGRPYTSPSEIAAALDEAGQVIFGNKQLLPQGDKINWSDAAAEELFARVYNSSTVRSRNFRIWIVGQAVSPTDKMTIEPEILSEVRRAYTVFADPGQRNADGTIDPTKTKLSILNENDF